MMLCDVPLHPRTRSTKGPDCPNDIQKRLRSPRQHLDDRQHSINPLPKRPAIDQRTEFVRLVRIHEPRTGGMSGMGSLESFRVPFTDEATPPSASPPSRSQCRLPSNPVSRASPLWN